MRTGSSARKLRRGGVDLLAGRALHRTMQCACLLLYRGSERRRIESIVCLPVEEFLRELHPARGLTSR